MPVSVAVGQNRGDGAWFWALPMDKFPHPGVSIVLDYMTVTLLFEKFDFTDPKQVQMKTRSRASMQELIEFFKTSNMKGTLTECVPRKYAMAEFEVQ